jgi:hypothetical protein
LPSFSSDSSYRADAAPRASAATPTWHGQIARFTAARVLKKMDCKNCPTVSIHGSEGFASGNAARHAAARAGVGGPFEFPVWPQSNRLSYTPKRDTTRVARQIDRHGNRTQYVGLSG